MSSRNKARRSPRLVPALAFLLATIVVGLVAFSFLANAPAAIPPEGLLVTVDDGSGAAVVGRNLEELGAIRSALAFRVLARLRGDEPRLKSGSYRISPGMGTWRIIDLIVSGRQALIRVTVPEGFALSQTATLLEKLGITTATAFKAAVSDRELIASLSIDASSLEGYLFPDTYFFPAKFDAKDVARSMVAAFRSRVAADLPEAASLDATELQDRVILASIIEREYRVAEEAPLMASVFYNRLRIGMALQSCATVVYVLTEKLGKPHPDVVYDRDLKIADPYNTYMQRGLPPGPICSPGLTALESVFRPASTRYLYFRLVDADAGRHHFSESLEEHIEATALFVKRVGG